MSRKTEDESLLEKCDAYVKRGKDVPTASPRRQVSDDSAESSKGKGEAEPYQNEKPATKSYMEEVPKPVFERDGALTQNNNNNVKDVDAEKAIELFVKTLQIDTNLFKGANDDNDYLNFLQLLISTDEKETDNFISVFETKWANSTVSKNIPQFFLYEDVYSSVALDLDKTPNKAKQKEYKEKFTKLLRSCAGKVSHDSQYTGIPVLFFVEYFGHSDKLFIKECEQIKEPNTAEGSNGNKDRRIIPVDTGIPVRDYLWAKSTLEQYEKEIKDENNTGATKSSTPKTQPKEDNLSLVLKISLYGLCRLNDLQRILESYKDSWLADKANRNKKMGASKSNDKIVATFGNYKNSRAKRYSECKLCLTEIKYAKQLEVVLRVLEHHARSMQFMHNSRLQSKLLEKINEIREEGIFKKSEGKLVIYSSDHPNVSSLVAARVKARLSEKNSEISRLKKDCTGKDEKISSLTEELKNEKENKNNLQKKFERELKENASLTSKLASKKDEIASKGKKEEDKSEAARSLREELKNKEAENEKLKGQLEKERGIIANLRAQLKGKNKHIRSLGLRSADAQGDDEEESSTEERSFKFY